jgi:inositol transporter-like SP family MFS transporter
MLFIGAVIVGLAVGADIPTSLALVGEMAPPEKRGRLLGFTQMLWSVGGLGVLLIVFATTPLGDWMPRILFGHLVVVALITWALRRRMPESVAWKEAADSGTAVPAEQRGGLRELLRGPLLRALAFTTAFYLLITLVTNFFGQFGTYMLITVSGLDQQSAVGVSLALFPLGLILVLVFMRLIDTRARTWMFFVGAVSQVAAFALLLFVPPTPSAVIVCMAVFLFGAAFAGETNYKVWSQELFPTLLRGTAQGFSFGVARVASAVFAVFIPTLLHLNFHVLIGILVAALLIAGVLGAVFQPRRIGRTVAEIDRDSVAGQEPPAAASAAEAAR